MYTSTTASASSEQEQYWRAESSYDSAVPLRWIDDCVNPKTSSAHASCTHLHERPRSPPKRLLDTGVKGEWPCVPKLIETSTLDPECVRYIALSHVWGSLSSEQKAAMSTTSSSLQARQQGLELATLPLQYVAVIILCRCLGFRYLWIDSLCIVQGDDEDWKEEAPRMASIYGSATLTIAINTKQNMFETFFAEHVSNQLEPPVEWVAVYRKLAEDTNPRRWFFRYHNFSRSLYAGGIVGDRAWCLQERQLSPRMIHLLDNKITLWECPSSRANTATPQHFPFIENKIATMLCDEKGSRGGLAMYQRYVDSDFHGKTGDHHHDYDNHLFFWHIMLRDISRRKLTFSSDNLTAIAGMAAQVHSNTGLTYLSGLWEEDMPRGLLWVRTFDHRAPHTQWTRFKHYQGPSWSWCSIDGPTQLIWFSEEAQMPIQFHPEEWQSMSDVTEVHRAQRGATANANQLEPLEEGSYLLMNGYLARFQCSGKVLNPPQFMEQKIGPDNRGTGNETNLCDLSQPEDTPDLRIRGAAVFDIPGECTARMVWCFVLAVAPRKPDDTSIAFAALVLDPVSADDVSLEGTTPITGDFRRIGLAHLRLESSGEWLAYLNGYLGDKVQVRIF